MMVELRLTQGYSCLIDDEDYSKLSKHGWVADVKINGDAYARATIKRRVVYMHRMLKGFPLGKCVDHENHDTLDNRKSNLRTCDRSGNNRNRKKTKGTSKYKGVCFHKVSGKWLAAIRADGSDFYLGLFENEINAAKAYNEKAIQLHGEFAWLNKI